MALDDFRRASAALDALIHYNPKNSALRDAVENTDQPLPPLFRRFGKSDEPEDDDAYINIREKIMSLDSVSVDDYNTITSCCASLHYDFVNFRVLEDQAVPEAMLLDEQPFEEKNIIDAKEEIEAFRLSDATLLEFLRARYPDIHGNELMSIYMRIALETGEKPMVFDSDFESELQDEHIDEEYNIISVRNRKPLTTHE